MKFKIKAPVKKGDEIYTVEGCKIEKYYVESIEFAELPEVDTEISHCIRVHVDRYKEPQNSSKNIILLSHCFLCKDELIRQL